ncbi:MAG: transporter substrate-binding domain-containing protein [Homoserinimonas sp.]
MKIRNLGVGLAAVLVMAGCSATGEAQPQSGQEQEAPETIETVDAYETITPDPAVQALLPDDIKANQEIDIVLTSGAPPTSFVSSDSKTSLGLNADLARAISRVMGVKANLVSVPLDGIIPGLQSQKYTMAVASMSPSPERLEVLDMVAFTKGGSAIAVAKGNPDGLTSDTLCGLRVAVSVGSYQATNRLPKLSEDSCISKGLAPIEAVEVPEQSQALLALSSGRVDGVMADGPVLGFAQKAEASPFEVIKDNSQLTSIGGMAVVKGSGMTRVLVKAMSVLQNLPEYKATYVKWGMDSYALEVDDLGQLK